MIRGVDAIQSRNRSSKNKFLNDVSGVATTVLVHTTRTTFILPSDDGSATIHHKVDIISCSNNVYTNIGGAVVVEQFLFIACLQRSQSDVSCSRNINSVTINRSNASIDPNGHHSFINTIGAASQILSDKHTIFFAVLQTISTQIRIAELLIEIQLLERRRFAVSSR